MKKVSMIAVLVLAVFVVNISAGPLNSFEQNPISYWDDNSLDVVFSWEQTDQTVDVVVDASKNELGVWEPFTPLYYWVESGFEPSDSSNVLDGILNLELLSDAPNDYDRYYTNGPDLSEAFSAMSVKWKVNQTVDVDYIMIIAWELDNLGGSQQYTSWDPSNTDWHITTKVFSSAQTVGCMELRFQSDNAAQTLFEVDWIRITDGTGDLDVGMPITEQETQSFEFYLNSTDLTSEVRLEIYDDTEALGTYCVFNSSYVIFQDANYAQTDGLARIRFSLDNERNTGTITVYAENSTLINQYETSILSGTNFLRMNDSVFNGSITLYYLNGDLSYTPELSIIEELFLSTGFVGYLGPLALVFVGWLLVKKDKGLGIIAFIVESLFVAQYLALVEATPDYWWQIFILIFGMLFTVVFPLWDR